MMTMVYRNDVVSAVLDIGVETERTNLNQIQILNIK